MELYEGMYYDGDGELIAPADANERLKRGVNAHRLKARDLDAASMTLIPVFGGGPRLCYMRSAPGGGLNRLDLDTRGESL